MFFLSFALEVNALLCFFRFYTKVVPEVLQSWVSKVMFRRTIDGPREAAVRAAQE